MKGDILNTDFIVFEDLQGYEDGTNTNKIQINIPSLIRRVLALEKRVKELEDGNRRVGK